MIPQKYQDYIKTLSPLFPVFLTLILTLFIFRKANNPGIFRTHDGEIHIIRALHFFSELTRGQIPVRMVPRMAYSYGYLIFQFFYPLPYYFNSVFQFFGMSTVESWKTMLFFTTWVSLLLYYHWLKKDFSRFTTSVGTIVFALVPFRFLTLFVTGQIGAQFSLLFVPLILIGLHETISESNKRGPYLISIGIAGLILSHLLSAIIFFLPILSYSIFLLLFKKPKNRSFLKTVVHMTIWGVIGLSLSSFYLVPFLLEKSWVQLGHSILVNHRDHWPSIQELIYSPWGFGYSNAHAGHGMSVQIGATLLLSWVVTLTILIYKIQKRQKVAQPLVFFIVFSLMVFLMVPQSSFIWELVTPLQLIQYPWRLLASTSILGSWLVAWVISNFKGRKQVLFGILFTVLAIWNVRHYAQPWPLDWKQDQDFIDDFYAYYGPTDISWELMPITASNIIRDKPTLVMNEDDNSIDVFEITWTDTSNTRLLVKYRAHEKHQVNLAVWDLPVWHVYVNSVKTTNDMAEDGTMLIPVESGEGVIELNLVRTTTQKVADTITVVSVVIILILAFKEKVPAINRKNSKDRI